MIPPSVLRTVMTPPEFVSDSPPLEDCHNHCTAEVLNRLTLGEPPPKTTIAAPAGRIVPGAKRWRNSVRGSGESCVFGVDSR